MPRGWWTGQIASIADGSGVRTAVDLQSRLNPAAVRAGELLAAGAIGRIVGASVLSTTAGFGRRIPEAGRSLEDPAVGMDLTTIQAAHTLDVVLRLTGPLTSFSALTTVQYPDLLVGDDGTPLHRTVPDHVLLQGRLDGGGALAVEVAGGRPPGHTPFRMEIVDEDGSLTLTGGAARGFQAGVLDLRLDGDPVRVEDPLPGLSASATNVAHVYAALRDDIVDGTHTAPVFSYAVQLSHLVDDVLTSAREQRAVTPRLPGRADGDRSVGPGVRGDGVRGDGERDLALAVVLGEPGDQRCPDVAVGVGAEGQT